MKLVVCFKQEVDVVKIPLDYLRKHLSGYEHRMNGYVAMTQKREHEEFVSIFSQS
ncbi:MAG: hypothetical protein ACOCXG_03895 [Nanoarchaeota archaeon]